MSRSRRKTPIFGVCESSEKLFKAFEHRRERRAVAQAILRDGDPPHPKQFGNPWSGPKDGKVYSGPGSFGAWRADKGRRPWNAK